METVSLFTGGGKVNKCGVPTPRVSLNREAMGGSDAPALTHVRVANLTVRRGTFSLPGILPAAPILT